MLQDQVLQLLGLKELLLARAQGEIVELRARVAELETQLAAPRRRHSPTQD